MEKDVFDISECVDVHVCMYACICMYICRAKNKVVGYFISFYEFDWPLVHVRTFECVLLGYVLWLAILDKCTKNGQCMATCYFGSAYVHVCRRRFVFFSCPLSSFHWFLALKVCDALSVQYENIGLYYRRGFISACMYLTQLLQGNALCMILSNRAVRSN